MGQLVVDYETLTFPRDPDLKFFVFTTEAGSTSRQAIERLAQAVHEKDE